VNVTVAICTWNRAALLDQTLTGMRDLRVPAGLAWEVVVVNNNCTDDTDAVLERHAKALPLRRVFEPRQGHSNARNCAIAHARGALLVWTDDDVLVDPGWLEEYTAAAARWPGAAVFGGRIDPWYEHAPPRWLRARERDFAGLLVARDLGAEERPLGADEYPFGANMMFPTAVLREYQFDPNFGKVGDQNILADETVLIDQVRAAGGRGVWVPAARVRHYVTARRMTLRYMWRYYYGQGRTHVRMGEVPGAAGAPALLGAPRWLYRRAAERAWVAAREWAGRRPGWGHTVSRVAVYAGMIAELRRRAAAGGGA
jgi:glycosyltransferase involved in cell wall biosynthesis